jgi:hypothetical protein
MAEPGMVAPVAQKTRSWMRSVNLSGRTFLQSLKGAGLERRERTKLPVPWGGADGGRKDGANSRQRAGFAEAALLMAKAQSLAFYCKGAATPMRAPVHRK